VTNFGGVAPNFYADSDLPLPTHNASSDDLPMSVAKADEGSDRAATLYSLLGTARLNGVNPMAYLTHVLIVINDYKVNAIEALLPWRLKETEPSIRVVESNLTQLPDRILEGRPCPRRIVDNDNVGLHPVTPTRSGYHQTSNTQYRY
jgi:hypothetical protein